MIYFEIQEEYGYREWIWAYPGTPAEAFADWKAGRRPLGGSYSPVPDAAVFNAASLDEQQKIIGWKGTLHGVEYSYVWSKRGRPYHCQEKGKANFCSACAEITVTEYLGGDDRGHGDGVAPFTAITNFKQFAGDGHVHEEDDTYFSVNGVGTIHDRHLKCPEGCETCWVCQAHTRSMSDKDYKCAVCEKPLCTVCSGCAETAFCAEHSVVDAIGLLEDS